MCGRFTLTVDENTIFEHFDLHQEIKIVPRFNIAPSQKALIIRQNSEQEREVAYLKWGLIPSWAKYSKISTRMINARAESVAFKPSFRSAFKKRRCLIPSNGYFEWQKEGNKKKPFYIKPKNSHLFSFAGLWECWEDKENNTISETCSIITTNSNDLISKVHDRMPVIIKPEDYEIWLNTKFKNTETLKSLLKPFDNNLFEIYPVTDLVNSPKNNSSKCIERIPEQQKLF